MKTLAWYIEKINLLLECENQPRLTALDMPTITAAHASCESLVVCWDAISSGREFERLEREHMGDADKQTGIYHPDVIAAVVDHRLAADIESFKQTKIPYARDVPAGFGIQHNGKFVSTLFNTREFAEHVARMNPPCDGPYELFYRVQA